MRFRFDFDKAMGAIAFVIQQRGSTDKIVLTKLLYLADRTHFIEHGVPITGDELVAMPYGPLPSDCLNIMNGLPVWPLERVYDVIRVNNNSIGLKPGAESATEALTEAEKMSILRVLDEVGGKSDRRIVKDAHDLPEYKRHYADGTSTPIPFESIAEASGDSRRFRHGRPVVSVEAARRLVGVPNPADRDL